jgi:hypothetical protein
VTSRSENASHAAPLNPNLRKSLRIPPARDSSFPNHPAQMKNGTVQAEKSARISIQVITCGPSLAHILLCLIPSRFPQVRGQRIKGAIDRCRNRKGLVCHCNIHDRKTHPYSESARSYGGSDNRARTEICPTGLPEITRAFWVRPRSDEGPSSAWVAISLLLTGARRVYVTSKTGTLLGSGGYRVDDWSGNAAAPIGPGDNRGALEHERHRHRASLRRPAARKHLLAEVDLLELSKPSFIASERRCESLLDSPGHASL